MDALFPLAAVAAVSAGLLGALRRDRANVRYNSPRPEGRRRQACADVLSEFSSRRGFLPEVASREELAELIDGGIEPEELRGLLHSRAADIPGTRLGHEVVDGARLPVILPPSFLMRHMLVPGKTGTGKSTLLTHLCVQFMKEGYGLATVVPEPEFVEGLLPLIPETRWDDVVVVDPGDTVAPVVMNPLEFEGQDLDLKVSQTLSALQRITGDDGNTGALRLEAILRSALYALTPLPGTTLLDVPKLLDRSDDRFRNWVVGQLEDDQTRHFWTSVYPSYPRDAHLSLTNRLERFLRPRAVRNFLCTPGRSLNVRRAMDEGRILLFVPADGLIGDESAQVLAQLFVSDLQLGTMSRADTPAHLRRPFMEVVDEFQVFAGSAGASTSYERSFQRARKYNVGLIVAFQTFASVPESLLRQILGNVGTVVAFELGATDARRLSREFVSEAGGVVSRVEPEEFIGLKVGQAICRVGRSILRVSTPPPAGTGEAGARQEIIRRSRDSFGNPLAPRPDRHRSNDGLQGLNPGEVF